MHIKLLFLFLMMSAFSFGQQIYYVNKLDSSWTRTEILEKAEVVGQRMFDGKKRVAVEVLDEVHQGDSVLRRFHYLIPNDSDTSFVRFHPIYHWLGKSFPDFQLTDMDGRTITLGSLKGKPTLINFWFTACAPCVAEIPSLDNLKEHYGDRVNFVAITFETEASVASFLVGKGFDYRHITDNYDLAEELDVDSHPQTIVLDDEARIVRHFGGLIVNMKQGEDLDVSGPVYEALDDLLLQ